MLNNKRILIVGNKLSGTSAYVFALNSGGKPEFYTDDLVIRRNSFDFAVISPGVSKHSTVYYKIKAQGIPILSELDFAYLNTLFNSISVTGTNGKTTVVNMVNGLLEVVGISSEKVGNIGIPFSSLNDNTLRIAELSSFMLEQSRYFRTDYSCITNITVDHLDYHLTRENYKNAKLKLISFTKKGICFDPSVIDQSLLPSRLQRITYSLGKDTDIFLDDSWICYREKGKTIKIIDIRGMQLVGTHNIENSMSALGLCILSNGYNANYAKFLSRYRGEKYRNEFVGIINSHRVYNDSKGTNVSSVIASYKTMNGATALILGGYDKGESYRPLFDIIKNGDRIYAQGDNGLSISDGASRANIKNTYCGTLEEAIVKALSCGCDNVLFSPGTSSFDRFTSYEQRGKFFDDYVKEFAKKAI